MKQNRHISVQSSSSLFGKVFKNKAELIKECIRVTDCVLDVGFSGQGIQHTDAKWPHALLKDQAKAVYGVDLAIDRTIFPDTIRYQEASAEQFSFPGLLFDKIFAGDLIEHLSNPGTFLEHCRAHLSPSGELILTTPNCFNLFNLTEKISKNEPTVNSDHTLYFNWKVLRKLLEKNGFEVSVISYVYSLEYTHPESLKKKVLNVLYYVCSLFTSKYIETLVVIARPKS